MKWKGFTLIELLVSIVVIITLALAMLMASRELSASAKASRIINNLETLKKAALVYFADNEDTFAKNASTKPDRNKIIEYVYNRPGEAADSGRNRFTDYEFGVQEEKSTGRQRWYVSYQGIDVWPLTDDEVMSIRTKLAGRAKSVGLLTGNGQPKRSFTAEGNVNNQSDSAVYMLVR